MRVFYAAETHHICTCVSDTLLGSFVLPWCQSGQEDDEDDVAVDDGDFLNEDELAELQRDEENIKKEVIHVLPPSTAVSTSEVGCVQNMEFYTGCISS